MAWQIAITSGILFVFVMLCAQLFSVLNKRGYEEPEWLQFIFGLIIIFAPNIGTAAVIVGVWTL